VSELDSLRGLLPDAEIAALEVFLTECRSGAAARKTAVERALEQVYRTAVDRGEAKLKRPAPDPI
jgi:hypothetical protein